MQTSPLQVPIDESPLQPFEKATLAESLSALTPEEQAAVAALFVEKPYLVPILYVNLLGKTMAAANNDAALLSRITTSEVFLLNSLDDDGSEDAISITHHRAGS